MPEKRQQISDIVVMFRAVEKLSHLWYIPEMALKVTKGPIFRILKSNRAEQRKQKNNNKNNRSLKIIKQIIFIETCSTRARGRAIVDYNAAKSTSISKVQTRSR